MTETIHKINAVIYLVGVEDEAETFYAMDSGLFTVLQTFPHDKGQVISTDCENIEEVSEEEIKERGLEE